MQPREGLAGSPNIAEAVPHLAITFFLISFQHSSLRSRCARNRHRCGSWEASKSVQNTKVKNLLTSRSGDGYVHFTVCTKSPGESLQRAAQDSKQILDDITKNVYDMYAPPILI